ncbi:MAG: hypothetical protein MAG451_01982 [Anaerolineales bacterium]|nr:hypothetical protein [Anaerolineales bacterium]
MTTNYDPDSEAALEAETLALFTDLKWTTANAQAESAGNCPVTGRETTGDVVLVDRLRAALARLNPDVPADALGLAIQELTRDRSAMTLVQANREIYALLKDGVKVTFRDQAGIEQVETVRVIDWDAPARNDFCLVSQLWVAGDPYTRRADLVGFVNGLPLVFVELKRHHRRLKHAYDGNLRDYVDTIPRC